MPARAGQNGAVTLPAPLGKRQVIVNNVATFWSTSVTALTLCGNAGIPCTPVPTSPPPASCSDVSYWWAMAATGPPEHADYNAVGCDGQWLVLDVGWPGGAAGCDGPSCGAGSTVTHWFFRASAKGWIVIASSLTAGCTRVHQVAPQFPTAPAPSSPLSARTRLRAKCLLEPRGRGGGPRRVPLMRLYKV